MNYAAAYIRVSTDDQLEYSPDSQLKIIREYAEKHQMVLQEQNIFIEDDGISGRKANKRAAFMQMISTAKQTPKPFDVILLWKFSRFARSREDSVVYKSMLRKQLGIDVVSVSEPLSDDKMSMLLEAMIEAMDEYYSMNLAEEVKRGMAEKARRGEPFTAPAFGYLMQDKKYIPDPDTAQIVAGIYHDFVHCGMSCKEIADHLNHIGVVTKRGNRFQSRSVRYILQNPVYCGVIKSKVCGSPAVKGCGNGQCLSDHQPIVEQQLWEQARSRLNRTKKKNCSGCPTPQNYMLRGLVRCSNCGKTLTRLSQDYLQCGGYSKGTCNVSHCISVRQLNQAVLDNVSRVLEDAVLSLPQENQGVKGRKAILKKQLLKERQKLSRIQRAYVEGADSLLEYKTKKQDCLDDINTLESEYSKTAQDRLFINTFTINSLYGNDLSEGEKNRILQSFIHHIVFDRKNGAVDIFYQPSDIADV